MRKGAAFDNVKAAWSKGLTIGDRTTTLKCNYDYNDNRDFLNEVSLEGDLTEKGDDLQVSYKASHNFKNKASAVKLSAATAGTTRTPPPPPPIAPLSQPSTLDLTL